MVLNKEDLDNLDLNDIANQFVQSNEHHFHI